MKALKDKKTLEFKEIFPNVESFIDFLKSINTNCNFDNFIILDKIIKIYEKCITEDGTINLRRKKFITYFYKEMDIFCGSITTSLYWTQRGWNELESEERRIKKLETRLNVDFVDLNLSKKFKFKKVLFESEKIPTCNCCGGDLIFKRFKNEKENYYFYKILDCKNEECNSKVDKKLKKSFDNYRQFLPEDISKEIIEKKTEDLKTRNPLCIEYWLKKGKTEEEAKKIISEKQKKTASLQTEFFGKNKDRLRKYGHSEEDIKRICLTPTTKDFWINKGMSEEEAKNKVYEIQKSNSQKKTQKMIEQPHLYSAITNTQLAFWINLGFDEKEARKKLSERQSTFTLEKCIKKHGEEEGYKVWRERQKKWQQSLADNGNMKCGYSFISQELFWEITKQYDIKELNKVHFADKNNEYAMYNEYFMFSYDFVDLNREKIIEYNGDLYHANPEIYKEDDCPNPFYKTKTSQDIWDRDLMKQQLAESYGFEVFVVWDSEYHKNKEETVKKCLNFLGIIQK